MKRRTFLGGVAGVAGGLALPAPLVPAADAADAAPSPAGPPQRTLGRTGCKVSIVGFPGLCLVHYDQKRCTEGLHAALDRGVNYFDVAPAYGNGDAETKMGIGLEGIPRDRYFLACKTNKRDGQQARFELERSLKRLKTDHFDLYQLHHLRYPDEVKQALGPGGAMEAILKAKEQGKVKYIGFSAHTTKGALEAMRGFAFDTVMFPINFVELLQRGFGQAVLDLARNQGAAVLAIKTMSRGLWPEGAQRTRKWWYRSVEEADEVDLAWRFTLSQPGVVAGFPPAFLDLLDKAIVACGNYRPITEPEVERLREIAKTCLSVFEREEAKVAIGPCGEPVYPDSPHECGGQAIA